MSNWNVYNYLALLYEKNHDFKNADKSFQEGLSKKLDKSENLQKSYKEFENRMEKRINREIGTSNIDCEMINNHLQNEVRKIKENIMNSGKQTSINIGQKRSNTNFNHFSTSLVRTNNNNQLNNFTLSTNSYLKEPNLNSILENNFHFVIKKQKIEIIKSNINNPENPLSTNAFYGNIPIYIDENNRNNFITQASQYVEIYGIICQFLIKNDKIFKIKDEEFQSNLKEEDEKKPYSFLKSDRSLVEITKDVEYEIIKNNLNKNLKKDNLDVNIIPKNNEDKTIKNDIYQTNNNLNKEIEKKKINQEDYMKAKEKKMHANKNIKNEILDKNKNPSISENSLDKDIKTNSVYEQNDNNQLKIEPKKDEKILDETINQMFIHNGRIQNGISNNSNYVKDKKIAVTINMKQNTNIRNLEIKPKSFNNNFKGDEKNVENDLNPLLLLLTKQAHDPTDVLNIGLEKGILKDNRSNILFYDDVKKIIFVKQDKEKEKPMVNKKFINSYKMINNIFKKVLPLEVYLINGYLENHRKKAESRKEKEFEMIKIENLNRCKKIENYSQKTRIQIVDSDGDLVITSDDETSNTKASKPQKMTKNKKMDDINQATKPENIFVNMSNNDNKSKVVEKFNNYNDKRDDSGTYFKEISLLKIVEKDEKFIHTELLNQKINEQNIRDAIEYIEQSNEQVKEKLLRDGIITKLEKIIDLKNNIESCLNINDMKEVKGKNLLLP